MNNERNKRIHALVKPGECWTSLEHDVDEELVCQRCLKNFRGHPDNTDWFSKTLPDNLRVAMVTTAVEKFGASKFGNAVGNFVFTASAMRVPAPAIAEAIDRLIQEAE